MLVPVNLWQICCGNEFLPNSDNSDHCIVSSIFRNFRNITKFKICKKDGSNLIISKNKSFWMVSHNKIESSDHLRFYWEFNLIIGDHKKGWISELLIIFNVRFISYWKLLLNFECLFTFCYSAWAN